MELDYWGTRAGEVLNLMHGDLMRLTLADLDTMPVMLLTALEVLASEHRLGDKPFGIEGS
jgi:hypothetical protein